VLSGFCRRGAEVFFGFEEARLAGAALREAADFLPVPRFAEAAGFLVTFFAMARLSYENA
jgi:hypothetical protein